MRSFVAQDVWARYVTPLWRILHLRVPKYLPSMYASLVLKIRNIHAPSPKSPEFNTSFKVLLKWGTNTTSIFSLPQQSQVSLALTPTEELCTHIHSAVGLMMTGSLFGA